MRITRYIREDLIKLEMDTVRDPEIEAQLEGQHDRIVAHYRERVIAEIADLLEQSGKVGNRNKLYTDLSNREKRACTAIGQAFAIPHVRTLQAKETIIGFLRSFNGLPFGAPDGLDVHIFLPIVGPPSDDTTYLRIYRRIGELLSEEGTRDRCLEVDQPGEVIRILGSAS